MPVFTSKFPPWTCGCLGCFWFLLFFWLRCLDTLAILLLIAARADALVTAFCVDTLLVLLSAYQLLLGTLINICTGALCDLVPAGTSLAVIRTGSSAAGANFITGFAGVGAFRVQAILIFFTWGRVFGALIYIDTSFLVIFLPAVLALITVLMGCSSAGLAGRVAFCAQGEGVVPNFIEVAVNTVQAELPFITLVTAALSVAPTTAIAVAHSISVTRSFRAPNTGIAVRSKRSFGTAHFDGFNAEPFMQIRMFCFPLEPPSLKMLLMLFYHAVALKAAAVTEPLHDLHQTNLTCLIFGQFPLLPGCVASAKVLLCCSVKALVEVVSDLLAGDTGGF